MDILELEREGWWVMATLGNGIDGLEMLGILEVDDNDDDIERRALLLAS